MIIQKDPPTDPILDNPDFRDPLFKKCTRVLLLGAAPVRFFEEVEGMDVDS